MGKKYEYKCTLDIQFLDATEYQNNEEFDPDEVLECQQEAVDKLYKLEGIRVVGNFEGYTSLEYGYIESIDFTIESDFEPGGMESYLEEIRQDINYGYKVNFEDINFNNDYIETIKKGLVGKIMTLEKLISTMEDYIGYEEEADINELECVKNNKLDCGYYYNIYIDILLNVDWKVVKKENNEDIYNRVIEVTDIYNIN